MGELTTQQWDRRARLISNIKESVQGIQADFLALYNEVLYKATHDTWHDFCRDELGVSKARAYQILDNSKTFSLFGEAQSTIVDSLKESHTREVAGLPDKKKVEVLKTAVETAPKDKAGQPKVTAKHVRETKEKVVQKKVRRDKAGTEIPDMLYEAFDRAEQFDAVLKTMIPRIGEVTLEICDWLYDGVRDERQLNKKGFLYSVIRDALNVVAEMYEKNKPRYVCAKCQGGGCIACKGRGWRP